MTTEHIATRLALRELVDTYALAVDKRDGALFAGLFTADASLDIYEVGQDQPALTYQGTQEIHSVVDLVAQFACTFHVVANHLVDVTGEGKATGSTYCLAHHLDQTESRDTLMLICYLDDYLLEDGVWRFARRRVMRQWNDTLAADRLPLVANQG